MVKIADLKVILIDNDLLLIYVKRHISH